MSFLSFQQAGKIRETGKTKNGGNKPAPSQNHQEIVRNINRGCRPEMPQGTKYQKLKTFRVYFEFSAWVNWKNIF